MQRILPATLALLLAACTYAPAGTALPPEVSRDLAGCNIVWDSPSKDSLDSMPLPGARGAGANVWVQDGSLWVYLAHNGAYDEQGRLLKLGCLRLTPVGADLQGATSFRQAQDLASGAIAVAITAKDGTAVALNLRFLGETLRVDAAASRDLAWDAAYGTWRDAAKQAKLDLFSGREAVGADAVAPAGDALRFIHMNGDSKREESLAGSQHVPPEAMPGVLPGRNFGGVLVAKGGLTFAPPADVNWQTWQGKAWTGRTVAAKHQTLAVALGAGKNADPAKWEAEARALLGGDARQAAEKAEDLRWARFWDRSFVFIQPRGEAKDPAFQVGRNFQLFRQMLACNAGGELPLKFNGGIFTTDTHPERVPARLNNPGIAVAPGGTTPDYRRWGQMFMAQNQRWIGWPTLANGDAELLAPSMAFYRDRHAIAKARAKNLGAQGACYVEPIGLEGTCCVAPNGQGLCTATHLTYQFSIATEHAWMALQAHDALGVPVDADIPWMVDIVRFYDSFYRAQNLKRTKSELNADGQLVLYPTNSLEYLSGATNAVEVVAGLTRLSEGLLALPQLSAADRDFVAKFQKALPPLPTMQRAGKTVLAPAAKWQGEHNPWELPELYAAWPYRLVGVTRPDTLPLIRDTWSTLAARGDNRGQIFCKLDFSWQANVCNTAAMGLADEARERAIFKLSDAASACRYPAFFGPGHDWMPDHNWGGSGSTGLQEMLVASDPGPHGKIRLLPAWPKAWDVRFKLHTAGETMVEAEAKGGKLVRLKVTPENRRKDVVAGEGWRLP